MAPPKGTVFLLSLVVAPMVFITPIFRILPFEVGIITLEESMPSKDQEDGSYPSQLILIIIRTPLERKAWLMEATAKEAHFVEPGVGP